MTDREDFIIYACELMRNRLIGDDIANAMGWNATEVRDIVPRRRRRRRCSARCSSCASCRT